MTVEQDAGKDLELDPESAENVIGGHSVRRTKKQAAHAASSAAAKGPDSSSSGDAAVTDYGPETEEGTDILS